MVGTDRASSHFEFATAGRIRFGRGRVLEAAPEAERVGRRVLLVTGRSPERGRPLANALSRRGLAVAWFHIAGEPTVDMIREGVSEARRLDAELVIGLGGGSAIDAAKAIAALCTNDGSVFDYLEVIGNGRPLEHAPAPCFAVPTTAGTGAEVTRNAVLSSPEHRVKVSLRHPLMLPELAIIDPDLTEDMPPGLTASTGLDALTQLIEPFVSPFASPLTDGFCREGLVRAARSLEAAVGEGTGRARDDMALASLFGGLALANARLGAVHGLAGPIGGMFPGAPHGAICGRLLPSVMNMNIEMLRKVGGTGLERYREVSQTLTGDPAAAPEDGAEWAERMVERISVPGLSAYGITPKDFPSVAEKAIVSSSMKGNPANLGLSSLEKILETSL